MHSLAFRYHKITICILSISLLLKWAVILWVGNLFDYHSDDRGYLESARIWLESGVFTYNDPQRPTVFITPAYPAFLAIFIHFFGYGFVAEQAVRLVQCLLMTASFYLLFLLGKRLFSAKVGLWAATACAFYPPLWLASNMLFTETLFVLAIVALATISIHIMERPSASGAFSFAIVFSVAVYIRPTIAMWPIIFFVLLLIWKKIPLKQLVRYAVIIIITGALCFAPWWIRNYEATGGHVVLLTKAGGNPLLLGTFPFTVPALFLEEQRTWHPTENLWENDQLDTKHAWERLRSGFTEQFWLYFSWYSLGKFLLFWGDVFYWLVIPGIPLTAAILYHYLLLIPGFIGMYKQRKRHELQLIISLLIYMTILHMVYLAHSRYSVPLMPFIALFAAAWIEGKRANSKENHQVN